MSADYTLVIKSVPTDAYRLKHLVYNWVSAVGVAVDQRPFLYARCPLDGTVIVRSTDRRLARISTDIRPMPQPEVGEIYDFCLNATPMVGKQPFGEKARRREAADPTKWLLDRSDDIGIEIRSVQHKTDWVWCSKRTKDMKGFYIPGVIYLGRLLVTDASKLSNALATGIGRHRAFGFGLLQLYLVEE